MRSIRSQSLMIGLLIAATGLFMTLSGCGGGGGAAKKVKTVSINFTQVAGTNVCINIKVTGAGGVFPGATWSTPPGAPTITHEGGDEFRLCWTWDFYNNNKFTAKATFTNEQRVDLVKVEVKQIAGDWKNIPKGGLKIEINGNVVAVSNPTDETLVLTRAQLAATTKPVSADQLADGDPFIESLNWYDLVPVPFTLKPGDQFEFEVPKDLVPPGHRIVTRYEVFDETDGPDVPLIAYSVMQDACPGDLNGDGVVDVLDLLLLLDNWGPCDDGTPCTGDLNDDNAIDVLDLLLLLDAWGECP